MASKMLKPFQYLYAESGLRTLLAANHNTHLIILTRTLRMFAYGFNALILALFFESLNFDDSSIGLFFTLTLLGDVFLSLLLTLVADSLGRRKILLFGAGLMVLSGLAFAMSSNYYILLGAAVFGVISPSGSEIGPFRAVEESMLAHLTVPETRTEVMSWYVVVPALGTSSGLLICGNLVNQLQKRGWTASESYHACFWIYALCGIVNMGLAVLMTSRCEIEEPTQRTHRRQSSTAKESLGSNPLDGTLPEKKKSRFAQISKESRPTLYKLCAIMSIDSLASGMAAYSLINLYIDRKFAIPKDYLGDIMSGIWLVSAFMNIWSSAIARRVGLIKTMIFTHLPSAIFLALLPVPKSVGWTAVLLVARASLSSMDQAPRAAFIAAVVKPEERTAVMGIVNVLKIAAQSSGPSITGLLAGHNIFWLAFVLAGSLKASYDLGLLGMFVNVKLHEHEKTKYQQIEQGDDVEGAFAIGEDEEADFLDEMSDGGDDEDKELMEDGKVDEDIPMKNMR